MKMRYLTGVSALALLMAAGAQPLNAQSAAEATAGGMVGSNASNVSGNASTDSGSVRSNEMTDSNDNFTGIGKFQGNNGDANLMQAATAVLADLALSGDVDSFATADSLTNDNTITSGPSERSNTVSGSFDGAAGEVAGQQNNGDGNAINSATAFVGSTADVDDVDQDALAEAETSGHTSGGQAIGPSGRNTLVDGTPGNTINDAGQRTNAIPGSFSGFAGVAQLQQNNGNANAMSTATAATGVDDGVSLEKIDQEVDAVARVTEQSVIQETGGVAFAGNERSNAISGDSFDNSAGAVSVQQNNGDVNAMASATAVVAVGSDQTSVGNGDGNIDNDAEDVLQNVQASENAIDGLEALDNGADRDNEIDAFKGFTGVASVQQNNGNVNAMGSATGVVAELDDGGDIGLQDVEAEDNTVADESDVTTRTAASADRDNDILDQSFNDGSGIVTVQQNNGDANTVNAATGVAWFGDDVGTIDQDADVENNGLTAQGSALAGNDDVFEHVDQGSKRTNDVANAFDNYSGIATVQQNNGNGNSVNAATAVAAAGTADAITQGDDDLQADNNDIDGIDVLDEGSDRDNNFDSGAFDGADGIITAQQNNGDGNSINAGTAVAGVTDSIFGEVTQEADAQFNDVENAVTVETASQADRDNAITSSFLTPDGVVTVQQNNGDANTMNSSTGVVGVVANTQPEDGPPDFGDASVDGDIIQNDIEAEDNTVLNVKADDLGSARDNAINSSFNQADGVTTVQQNNGNANSINQATVVAGAGSTTGDVEQGDGSDNEVDSNDVRNVTVDQVGGTRKNEINPSFTDANGLHTVQQNNGDANTINAAVAVVAVGGDIDGDVTQDLDMRDNRVEDVSLFDDGSVRENAIKGSFNDASGVVTVQQNNGNANSINAGAAAALTAGGVDDVDQKVDVEGRIADAGAVETTGFNGSTPTGKRDNAIGATNSPSFQGISGHLIGQQNNGDGNVVGAGTALTVSNGMTDENDIDQVVDANGTVNASGNQDVAIDDDGFGRTNTVDYGSFNGMSGLVFLQQNNGDANALSIANGVLINAGGRSADDSDQDVSAAGTIVGVDFADDDVEGTTGNRLNTLGSAFNDGGSGIVTVQQNNGSANAMSASYGIVQDAGGENDDAETVEKQTVAATGTVTRNVGDIDGASGGDPERSNVIGGQNNSAFDGFQGLFTVQQNNGDNNAVLSATAVRVNTGNEDLEGPNSATSTVTGTVTDNTDSQPGGSANDATLSNAISNTANGDASGVATLQQNNGNNNVLASSTGITASTGSGAGSTQATSTASGTGTVKDNLADVDAGASRVNDLSDSFSGFAGVATVQQNNGANNVIGDAMQLNAANVTGGTGPFSNPSASVASLGAVVTGNTSNVAANVTLSNTITNAFTGASGLAAITQNNGNNNVVGSAVSVTVNY